MKKNFCSQCGTQLGPNARFCSSCGHPVHGAAVAQKDMHKKESAPTASKPVHAQSSAGQHMNLNKFNHPRSKRHSEIITTDAVNGEPIVKVRNLHPNAVWLFFLQYLGKSSILLLLFIMTAFVEPLLAVAVFVAYFGVLYFVAKLTYKNYEFEITDVAFRKAHGIFHKYTVNIAFNQIQNINKRRSVVDQLLGLAHLEIETSGTGGVVKKSVGGLSTVSEGYIPGITPEEAQDIMNLMLTRVEY